MKFFFLLLVIVGMSSCKRQEKFDKKKWSQIGDVMTFPHRKYMVEDLIKSYPLKGMRYKEILLLLGPPQGTDSEFEIFYDVEVEYGTDIDPIIPDR